MECIEVSLNGERVPSAIVLAEICRVLKAPADDILELK
jgi:hypothetical protein|nr:MAG TPA: helix-turn-helix protein [Caudoviricetes sp.]